MPIITEQEIQVTPSLDEAREGVEESEEVQEEQQPEEFSQGVEALEVTEDVEEQHGFSLGTIESRSRSSSITSWESTPGMFTATEASASELSSSRYSTITQEDFQQELVVKAIKLKKKGKRRRHG